MTQKKNKNGSKACKAGTHKNAGAQKAMYDQYLLPCKTIIAASKGDVEALNTILKHFEPYINALSVRTLYDENGQAVPYYDQELKRILETQLIVNTLRFKVLLSA